MRQRHFSTIVFVRLVRLKPVKNNVCCTLGASCVVYLHKTPAEVNAWALHLCQWELYPHISQCMGAVSLHMSTSQGALLPCTSEWALNPKVLHRSMGVVSFTCSTRLDWSTCVLSLSQSIPTDTRQRA